MTQERQFKVGDKVILGEHQEDPNGKFLKNWNASMDQYVGKVATIAMVLCVGTGDQSGSICYRVDTNPFLWRGINMTPVDQVATAPKPTTYGAKCGKCQEYNEFAIASDSFVCYGCSH